MSQALHLSPLHAGRSMAAQRGIALIIGLIILAVLSMIGVAAFSITTQEERMAGNSRDRMRAFEAAEAALRACENFVKGAGPAFATSGTAGMYTAPPSTQPTNAEGLSDSDWYDQAKVYQDPSLTGTGGTNPEWSKPPACVAEYFQVPRGASTPGTPLQMADMAHITARGFGLNKNTVVSLESYFAL
jgi:type IV pilus assembly protein PilX